MERKTIAWIIGGILGWVVLCCAVLFIFTRQAIHDIGTVQPTSFPSARRVMATVSGPTIPNGPDVRTQKDMHVVLKKFYRRTIVDSYKEHGTHSPKWDKAAIQFLTHYADSRIPVPCPCAAPPSNLPAECKAVIALGCIDPEVGSCYGILLCGSGKKDEGIRLLRESLSRYEKSAYPKCRMRTVPINLIYELQEFGNKGISKEELARLRELVFKWTVDSFVDGSYRPGDDEAIIYTVVPEQGDGSEGLFGGRWIDLYAAIQNKAGAFPYASDYIGGYCHISHAWELRGSGYADTVTREGWRGYEKEFGLARKLLTRAWKRNPGLPEAPCEMIEVATGDDRGPDDNLVKWFERSVAAQIDYDPAYMRGRFGQLPRWGGDYPHMYALGVSALMTKRFDTGAPWQFYQTVAEITHDVHGDRSYWKSPETTKYLKILFDGYAKSGYEGSPEHIRSVEAAMAFYCGRFDDARRILDQLGNKVEKNMFLQMGTPYSLARRQIYGESQTGH